MIDTAEFLVHARLDAQVLETWIEYGWLVPRREPDMRGFSEIDLARVQLIRDLKNDMGVNDEGIAVVLDLVDQIHGLRRTLRGLASAISTQPEALRRQIVAAAVQSTTGRRHEEMSSRSS
jgi:chaperone modulatory protein CbpM